jgi:tRNA-splicing ligase RtcB
VRGDNLTEDARVVGWLDGVEVDSNTIEQARLTSQLKYVYKHVALMPDAHLGIGATVGSVVPLLGAVIPAAVGVDIGCGMMARRLPGVAVKGMNASELACAREAIEKAIPVGMSANVEVEATAQNRWHWTLHNKTYTEVIVPAVGEKARQSPEQQLGTMGGGNHFLELCLDELDRTWIVLHSGSRGIGNRIGRHFIGVAKRECEKWGVELPHSDLAYLPEGTPQFDQYVAAVEWAQGYARINRELMMSQAILALKNLGSPWGMAGAYGGETVISCHHNYIARENHFGKNLIITRKGALRAREGDMGIIPGSMGAETFIVRGKGDRDSFTSCSHGAGRRMSRKEAKRQFTQSDLIGATVGIECRKDAEVIDEIPYAYKDIHAVMRAQKDLVEIVHTLRQVVNIKG